MRTKAKLDAGEGMVAAAALPRWRSDFDPPQQGSGWVATAAVVGLHALVGLALLDATQRPALQPALEPILIQQIRLPPPAPAVAPPPTPPAQTQPPQERRPVPPPVPSQRPATVLPQAPQPMVDATAPAVAQPVAPTAPVLPVAPSPAPSPAPAPVVPAPTTPAPPPSAPSRPAAGRSEIGVACPTQVQPEMPRRALQEGLGGVVRAQAVIRNGAVVEVTVLSGPRIFHAAVRAAMLQYRCVSGADEVTAVQEFAFRVE